MNRIVKGILLIHVVFIGFVLLFLLDFRFFAIF